MKYFALIAFALCACAFATVDFTPHPLGCEFTITMGIEAEPDDAEGSLVPSATYYLYLHGTYAMIIVEPAPPQVGFYQTLARTDIRKPVTGEQGVFSVDDEGSESDEDKCETHMVDRKDVLENIDEYLFYFNETHTMENVTTGKFDGKDCKVYFMHDEDSKHYVYVDNDNFIIGYEETAPKEHVIYHISYEMKAPLDLFVIDKDKYPGCPNAASVPPVVDTCQTLVVQPRELPCAFHVDWKSNYTDMYGTLIEDVANIVDVHGSYLKLEIQENMSSGEKSDTLMVVRADMVEGDNITVFEVSSEYPNMCFGQMVPRSEIANLTGQFFSIFYDPKVYEAKIEGEFMGQKCIYYYLYDKDNDYVLIYALDDKNTIIGGSANLAQQAIENVRISYVFDAPLSAFVIDKSNAGCNESAYTAPVFETCKSSSSSGSIVKAGFGVVVASLIIALVSLF